ncbi:MAG TPA: TlpA disulfide reductase family protein [Nitrospirota bacterium]
MSRKLLIPVIVAMALLFGCTKSSQSDSSAPDFSLQDMAGKTVKLSDYKGKVVLLEFWATWCPPCRASVPGIEKLHEAYKDKGLAVLAVSMDEGGWDVVKSFMKEQGITYSVLQGNEEVAGKYEVRSIPMLLILNKEGRITRRYLGFGNDEELEKDIKAFL